MADPRIFDYASQFQNQMMGQKQAGLLDFQNQMDRLNANQVKTPAVSPAFNLQQVFGGK